MVTVTVRRTIAASPRAVFASLSDHVALATLVGGRGKLLKLGEPDPNGLGAVREIIAGRIRFEEEIISFEPGYAYGYIIRRCTLPLEHEGGEVTVTPTAGGAEVCWTSTYRFRVPLLGDVLAGLSKSQVSDTFAKALERLDHQLTSETHAHDHAR